MATSSSAISLLKAIETTSAAVGVVGMGYVGFPLACAVDRAGYQTCGFDVDPIKIERLFAGKTYLGHMTDEPFAALAGSDRFSATSNVSDLSVCDVIILCVPTPLGEENEPRLVVRHPVDKVSCIHSSTGHVDRSRVDDMARDNQRSHASNS